MSAQSQDEQSRADAHPVGSSDLVARLRKGPIREIVRMKDGWMESIYDTGANMRLMREAAERIEDLEYLLEGICGSGDHIVGSNKKV